MLAVGGLGLLWLLLAGLLILHLDQERRPAAHTEAADASSNDEVWREHPTVDSHSDHQRDPFAASAALVTEPASGPEVERILETLFEEVLPYLSSSAATLSSEHVAQVRTIVERLNAEGAPVVVRFSDPSLDAARRRAVKAHALLVDAGLRPWLVETYGTMGQAAILAQSIE